MCLYPLFFIWVLATPCITIRTQEEEKLLVAHFSKVISECDILILSGIRDVEVYTIKARATANLFHINNSGTEFGRRAVNEYLKAIVLSLSEEARELWAELADFSSYLPDPRMGIMFYHPLARLEINGAEYIGKLAYMRYRQGDDKTSKKYLEKLETMEPLLGEYNNILASIYEKMKEYDRAEKQLRKAIEIEPEKETRYWKLAEFLVRRAYDLIPQGSHFGYVSEEKKKKYTALFRGAIELMEISYEKPPIITGGKSLILNNLENYYAAIKDYDMATRTNERLDEQMKKETEEMQDIWNMER